MKAQAPAVPAALYAGKAQFTHAAAPGALYVPAAQMAHALGLLCPGRRENLPPAHAVQKAREGAPTVALQVPAGHCTQAAEPAGAQRPVGQRLHPMAPLPLVVPGGQARHAPSPALGAKRPALQLLHAALPGAGTVPAAQGKQASAVPGN